MDNNLQLKRRCVFLPCSSESVWAVPQNTVAEILTVNTDLNQPPTEVSWREQTVPVLDLDSESDTPWRNERTGAGLVAVLLGLQDSGCDYWALALRGTGLGMDVISDEQLQDCPELAAKDSLAAFRWSGNLYQVPDLQVFQQRIVSAQSQLYRSQDTRPQADTTYRNSM